VCVCACVRACACACVRACVRAMLLISHACLLFLSLLLLLLILPLLLLVHQLEERDKEDAKSKGEAISYMDQVYMFQKPVYINLFT
jgi:ABC-type transport system involved in cytochrome bd biosynthesis fused ATPase/permease subunit